MKKLNKRIIVIALTIGVLFLNLNLESSAINFSKLFEQHSPFMPDTYSSAFRFKNNNSMSVETLARFSENLLLGINYEITNLTGDHQAKPQQYPGINISYLVVENKILFPDLMIGYSNTSFLSNSASNDKPTNSGLYLSLSRLFIENFSETIHGIYFSFSYDINNYYNSNTNSSLAYEFRPINKISIIFESSYDEFNFKSNLGLDFRIDSHLIISMYFKNIITANTGHGKREIQLLYKF